MKVITAPSIGAKIDLLNGETMTIFKFKRIKSKDMFKIEETPQGFVSINIRTQERKPINSITHKLQDFIPYIEI